jgi:hypothetical protein
MSISDEELLRNIWVNQLRILAGNVTIRHCNSRFGVVSDDEYNFSRVSAQARISCDRITDVLGHDQLKRRIRRLCDRGHIRPYGGQDMSHFFITGDMAMEAFREARNWWMNKGVPTGWTGEGSYKSSPLPAQEDIMKWECEDHLVRFFGRKDFRLSATKAHHKAA